MAGQTQRLRLRNTDPSPSRDQTSLIVGDSSGRARPRHESRVRFRNRTASLGVIGHAKVHDARACCTTLRRRSMVWPHASQTRLPALICGSCRWVGTDVTQLGAEFATVFDRTLRPEKKKVVCWGTERGRHPRASRYISVYLYLTCSGERERGRVLLDQSWRSLRPADYCTLVNKGG